jgi:hypothetical protein
MTKVQIRFHLERPLEDAMLARLSNAYAQYGIQKITLAPGLDSLVVEYDATRLRPAEVEAAIANAGIAVKPTAA